MGKTLPAPEYTAPEGHGWPCSQQREWLKEFEAKKAEAQKQGGKK